MDSPEGEQKRRPSRRGTWVQAPDTVTDKGLSACGAQPFFTVSVLSWSLSLIILADFFCGGACLSAEVSILCLV